MKTHLFCYNHDLAYSVLIVPDSMYEHDRISGHERTWLSTRCDIFHVLYGMLASMYIYFHHRIDDTQQVYIAFRRAASLQLDTRLPDLFWKHLYDRML